MDGWKLGTKPVIGLAGGIGSGKSFVANLFRELGCGIIDADELARQAFAEPDLRSRIRDRFGDAIMNGDGSIDRKSLAREVFGRPDTLRDLEAIVHPYVHALRIQLRQAMAADPDVVAVVEDCPLLFEKGLDSQCDHTIFVQASREERLRRLARSRGWTDEELAAREKNQLDLDIKAKSAHHVIQNDLGEASTREQVRRVLSMILHPLII